MQPHQQRVVEEAAELKTKIEKLTAFINGEVFKSIDSGEQQLLALQLEVMREYVQILGYRIAKFQS